MRLLIVTQVVDSEDPGLGFFHGWLAELATQFTAIEVICLKKGRYELPEHVRVHSLGKEKGGRPSLVYAFRFLMLSWKLRKKYDAVFVHMNQEYLLIAGWLWKLLGKSMYLWRNHYAGSLLTDLAATFCKKVFCTSKHSYTARYTKTVLMPVGVDTMRFTPDTRIARVPRSILFFSRIAESKRPGMLITALIALHKRGIEFTASFVGSSLPNDEPYLVSLKQRVADAGLMDQITFSPGIPNAQAPDLYHAHHIFVNTSPSGMLDKTIFEAAASGCIVLASSDDYRALAGDEFWFKDAPMLTDRLEAALSRSLVPIPPLVRIHSLGALTDRLSQELTS